MVAGGAVVAGGSSVPVGSGSASDGAAVASSVAYGCAVPVSAGTACATTVDQPITGTTNSATAVAEGFDGTP